MAWKSASREKPRIVHAPTNIAGIAGLLGGISMAVESNPGLYAYAPDADAYRAGDVTFVQVTSEADSTSLTAIRPIK